MCAIVLRLTVNLKLIKDTLLRSLLTRLFTFPSPFFFPNPFIHPSVPQCSLSLRIRADGRGTCCLMPGGQAIEGVREIEIEGSREREGARVYSCGHGMASHSALTCDKAAVTLFPDPFPNKSCGFFQIFDLFLQWMMMMRKLLMFSSLKLYPFLILYGHN